MSMIGLPYGRTYRYFTGPSPVFNFGEGLSYSTWSLHNLSLAVVSSTGILYHQQDQFNPLFSPCDSIVISLDLLNEGPFDGDQVLQVYVRLQDVSLLTPLLSLASFQRTFLANQNSSNLQFLLPPRAFSIVNGDTRAWELMPASVGIFIGFTMPISEANWSGLQAFRIQLTGPVRPLADCYNSSFGVRMY